MARPRRRAKNDMSRCASNRGLLIALAVTLAILAASAVVFYHTQNSAARIGGVMAPSKAFWLSYAILLWIVLPLLICLDTRVMRTLRYAFATLFVLMALRAAVELRMLFVTLDWSPWYGIVHDLVCMAALIGWGCAAAAQPARRTAPNGLLLVHLAVTAAAFVPEIYFAHYMTRHFDTAGADAIYFVPADERYREVLAWTTRVVVVLSAYLPWFFWRWLVGTSRSKPARTG